MVPSMVPSKPAKQSKAKQSIAEKSRADTATLCSAESVAVSSEAEREKAERKDAGARAESPFGGGDSAAAVADKEAAYEGTVSPYRDRRFGEALTPEEKRKADVARQEATARLQQLLPGLKWLREG